MRTNHAVATGQTHRPMMVVLAGMLLGLLAWAVAVVPASAHVHLESSSPAADSASPTAPTEIRLVFDGELAPEGHTITLLGPDGAPVQLDAAQLDLNDMERRTVVVPLPTNLATGTYIVEYSVLPADGHEAATGSFAFTIGEVSAATPGATPGATPVATPVGTPAATPAAQSAGGAAPTDAGMSGNGLAMPVAILLVALAIAVYTRRRLSARS